MLVIGEIGVTKLSLQMKMFKIFPFMADATGRIWEVQLNYSTTGNFTLVGNASNALNWVSVRASQSLVSNAF